MFSKLRNQPITDIMQVGVVDVEEGIGEMTTFHTYLYIQFGEILLKLESVNQYSKLLMQFVDKLDFKFDFDLEEDMIPTKNSIAEIVLTNTMIDNRILCVNIYGGEFDQDELLCNALSFELASGQELFFDPTFHFGINIGGIELREAWCTNYPNDGINIISKESIKL